MPRKRLEFSLSPFQAVLLGTAGTLVLVISFIIGMLVGKEMQGSSILERDVKSDIVKMKIEPLPLPPAQAPSAGDTAGSTVMTNVTSKPVITFYDTLTKTGKKKEHPPSKEQPAEDEKESLRKAYTIQVGAMKDKTLANGMVAKLKKNGYSAYISESSGGWYKVRLGTFYSKVDAKKEAVKIKRNEGLSSTVVEK